MWKKILGGSSFKRKLMVVLLLVGLVPLIVVSIMYQNLLSRQILKDTEKASIETLKYLSMNIQRQLDKAEQLMGWFTYNKNLEAILSRQYDETYERQLDIIAFSKNVTDYLINADIDSDILKIMVLDDDNLSFQIGNGLSYLQEQELVDGKWLEEYERKQADELVYSKDFYLKDTLVFPMSGRIYDSMTGKPIGWCLIVFQNNMYSNYLMDGAGTDSHEQLLLINGQGQCIAHTKRDMLGQKLTEDGLLAQIPGSGGQTGHVTGVYEGEATIMHYYRIPDTDMIAIQGTSLETFLQDKKAMSQMTMMVMAVTAVVILLVIFYLRNLLMRPIHTIRDYIRHVPESGFEGNLILSGDDEFKKIAESINTMEREIRELMEKQRQEAEVKKALEFQVLQNQINPHFLYNTLNSIKWMATLQHADTIRDMTAALGRLLQNISKGSDRKIPIYEEMSLLDDYILIQDIRYNGKIKVEYHLGNHEITQAYIIKFLLQPIVENAIFHGIEPKDGTGTIEIKMEPDGGDVRISIEDDGIGMTREQIEKLLNPATCGQNVRGLSGIGVANIQERIVRTYGDGYGIQIESCPGAFTRVTIRIPYEREG